MVIFCSCNRATENLWTPKIDECDIIYLRDYRVSHTIQNYAVVRIGNARQLNLDQTENVLIVSGFDTIPLNIRSFANNFEVTNDTLSIKFVTSSNYNSLYNYYSKTPLLYSDCSLLLRDVNKQPIKLDFSSDVTFQTFLGNSIIDIENRKEYLDSIDYRFESIGLRFIFPDKEELYDFIKIEPPVPPVDNNLNK